jgi:hypothetical protein
MENWPARGISAADCINALTLLTKKYIFILYDEKITFWGGYPLHLNWPEDCSLLKVDRGQNHSFSNKK